MRLTKEEVQKRENFVRYLITTNPKMTGREVQELLVQEFGKKMRLKRLYELKKESIKDDSVVLHINTTNTNTTNTNTTPTTTTETPTEFFAAVNGS